MKRKFRHKGRNDIPVYFLLEVSLRHEHHGEHENEQGHGFHDTEHPKRPDQLNAH